MRTAVAAQQGLVLLIFHLGNYRLVLPLIPLTAAAGVFKTTVTEGLDENLCSVFMLATLSPKSTKP